MIEFLKDNLLMAERGQETGRQDENEIPKARFDLGEVKLTREAQFSLQRVGRNWTQLASEHLIGNWGNVDPHDAEGNEQSADLGSGRIISIYDIEDARFCVRTDPTDEGNVTTIYLPYGAP